MKTKAEISSKKAKINKWSFDYVIQGNYGSGWDDLTTEETYLDGINQLKCYNENENYPHRLIKRKVLNIKYIDHYYK